MTTTYLEQLLAVGGPPLGPRLTELPKEIADLAAPYASMLEALLVHKNGFFAFARALHVFPVGPASDGYAISAWNSSDLWRADYGDMTERYFFIAEDLFGEQFALHKGEIYRFNPEAGAGERVASDLEEWARRMLDDDEVETGSALARAWQAQHGPIPGRQRLIPKIPFVGGGAFQLDNLYLEDAAQGMRYRADIARQIRDLPDGAKVSFIVTD